MFFTSQTFEISALGQKQENGFKLVLLFEGPSLPHLYETLELLGNYICHDSMDFRMWTAYSETSGE